MYKHLSSITLAILIASLSSLGAQDFEAMFQERLKSVVVVEFFVETEEDRWSVDVNGIVVDDDGLIQLQDNALPAWIPVEQLKEFKVFQPGNLDEHDAEYLGQDRVFGWHYVRVLDEELKRSLISVTSYPIAELKTGSALWGIGLAAKGLDFTPYFMRSEVATIQPMPNEIGFCTFDISSPGSVVFDLDGNFAGWGANPLNFDRVFTIEGRRFKGQIAKTDETSTFFVATDLVGSFGNPPESVEVIDWAWSGLLGLGPLDDEVSELMGLRGESAITVSEILENGPADRAGIEDRDIIVSLNGESFKRYIPRHIVVSAFERQLKQLNVGDQVSVGVLRGQERLELELILEEHPTLVRQAERTYFEKLGLTLREFLLLDRVTLNVREGDQNSDGVIVSFVKTNSFAQTAGLASGDLIQEIDGNLISDYSSAVELVSEILADEDRKDFVVLVRRGAETSVLRINLK
ncbi:PDZ domain-containing protein [Puniceicoccaceae bacterium K14]|nr:PDZ domain-containing protein [Puniceicoccaceae bacterium K14]